jgi:hypothetical protein
MPMMDIDELSTKYDEAREQALQAVQKWTMLSEAEKQGDSGSCLAGMLKEISGNLAMPKATVEQYWASVHNEVTAFSNHGTPEDLLSNRFLASLRKEADLQELFNKMSALEQSIAKCIGQ